MDNQGFIYYLYWEESREVTPWEVTESLGNLGAPRDKEFGGNSKEVSRKEFVDSCKQSRNKLDWLVWVGVGESEEGYIEQIKKYSVMNRGTTWLSSHVNVHSIIKGKIDRFLGLQAWQPPEGGALTTFTLISTELSVFPLLCLQSLRALTRGLSHSSHSQPTYY